MSQRFPPTQREKDFQEFRSAAFGERGLDLPHYTSVGKRGRNSREHLASQALYHILLKGPEVTKEEAVQIALFGTPIFAFLLRYFLTRFAEWVWERIQHKRAALAIP